MRRQKQVHRNLFYLFLVFTIFSCAQDEEGCIDVRAKNFNIEADKNCCCTYPVMSVEISPIFGETSTPFRAGLPYNFPGEPVFKVLEHQIYLRGVSQVNGTGEEFKITDELDLCIQDEVGNPEGNVRIRDDVFLYKLGSLRSEIGTFPEPGSYTSLSFNSSLGDTLRFACTQDLPSGHPLRDGRMNENNSRLIDLLLYVIPDTLSSQDTLYLRSELNGVEVDVIGSYVIPERTDFLIPLTLDYKVLLKDVDFKNDSEQTIVTKLNNNLTTAWQLN